MLSEIMSRSCDFFYLPASLQGREVTPLTSERPVGPMWLPPIEIHHHIDENIPFALVLSLPHRPSHVQPFLCNMQALILPRKSSPGLNKEYGRKFLAAFFGENIVEIDFFQRNSAEEYLCHTIYPIPIGGYFCVLVPFLDDVLNNNF